MQAVSKKVLSQRTRRFFFLARKHRKNAVKNGRFNLVEFYLFLWIGKNGPHLNDYV